MTEYNNVTTVNNIMKYPAGACLEKKAIKKIIGNKNQYLFFSYLIEKINAYTPI